MKHILDCQSLSTMISKDNKEETPMKKGHHSKPWIKPVIFILILIAVIITARILGLGEKLNAVREWIKTLGHWGPVVYIFIYAIAVVAAVPASALTLVAGAMFGSFIGTGCVSIGSTLGAGLAFLTARYFARGTVSGWLNKNKKFQKLDNMTEKHGAVIVAITRLVPLFPFTILNYGFGLTKISFKIYLLWSWLCMLPGTVLFVVGADAFTKGISRGKVPWALIGILAVVILLLIFLVRRAKGALKGKEDKIKK